MEILSLEAKFFNDVVKLQRLCFPAPFPEDLLWKAEHLQRHIEIFSAGQFVAVLDGEVVGSCTSMIIKESAWKAHVSFDETVGSLFLDNHTPDGNTLFGVDISVHPERRKMGIGRKLYEARFDLTRKLKLKQYATSVRIPDFSNFHLRTGLSKNDYVDKVISGIEIDRTLTPFIKMGFKFDCIIENHMEDPESGDAAVSLVWVPV